MHVDGIPGVVCKDGSYMIAWAHMSFLRAYMCFSVWHCDHWSCFGGRASRAMVKRNTHLSLFNWRGCRYVAEGCHSSWTLIDGRTVISPVMQDVRAAYDKLLGNAWRGHALEGTVCDFGGLENFGVGPPVDAMCVIIQELIFLRYPAPFCLSINQEMRFIFSYYRYYVFEELNLLMGLVHTYLNRDLCRATSANNNQINHIFSYW